MYLLDTNVISAFSPARRAAGGHEALADWLLVHSDQLYLSVVTVTEIRSGIAASHRAGATRKATILAKWWIGIEHLYGDRLLPFSQPVAQRAGELMDRARGMGSDPGFEDVAIAATAVHHRFVTVTFNARHFRPMGIAMLDAAEIGVGTD